MKILVCGGRNFSDYNQMTRVMSAAVERLGMTVVIHGAMSGADNMAGRWARSAGLIEDPYPAEWDDISAPGAVVRTRRDGTKYNAKAGPMRNQRMLDIGKPDCVIAFHGGDGTADMKARADKAGIPVHEIKPASRK